MLMFAIVFGLSMDYEVFLLSRVREAWHQTGDAHRAVAIGIGSTARVITTAAAIMVVVFSSFVLDTDPTIKMLAVGMAVAVLIDASVVRMVLVPALMSILGPHAWWLPRWLDRIIPDLQLEGPIEPVPATEPESEPVAAGATAVTRRGPRPLAVLVAALALLLAGCTGSDDEPERPAGPSAALRLAPHCPPPPQPPRKPTLDQVNKLGASVDLPGGRRATSGRAAGSATAGWSGSSATPRAPSSSRRSSPTRCSSRRGRCIAQLRGREEGARHPRRLAERRAVADVGGRRARGRPRRGHGALLPHRPG